MALNELKHERLTHSVMQNHLCATRLELGLLLHFGGTAKFYRQVG